MKIAGCPAMASGSTIFLPESVSASVCGITCAERFAANSVSMIARQVVEIILFLCEDAGGIRTARWLESKQWDTNYFISISSESLVGTMRLSSNEVVGEAKIKIVKPDG